MGGQKFQYDESGGTFFYFLLSFLGLILIPTTWYFWPSKKKDDPDTYNDECQCPPCIRKYTLMASAKPLKSVKSWTIRCSIVAGWLLLIYLTYRVSQFDYEMANFDPYEILEITSGASQSEVKKAYRRLSLIYHPDKDGGDEKLFMKLSKAYQALTDDEARKNWEKYGNPDGPGVMSFGIALPSWIVEKENSVWVLGLYALVFMVALPTAVGTWWYRSIRFSGDKVLLDTTQMYFYFFHKTPEMAMKRVIMILGASLEFDKRHNSQIVERPSDNEEVPSLIRHLPNLNENCKELPLCCMYSVKARAIIHAHLSRIILNYETLDRDRQLIVQKCPYLIQEMVSCVNQLIMLAYAGRVAKVPSIETIENCMKLSPMIVQGLWEFKSPFLQLPYVMEDSLRAFTTKKRHIKNLQQFAQLKPDDSRHLLKHLNDDEYLNVMKVLRRMPLIDFSIRCEVIDDENTNVVTAGAIVTVTVTLIRNNMSDLFGDSTAIVQEEIDEDAAANEENSELIKSEGNQKVIKKMAWMRPTKRSHKGGSGPGGRNKHKPGGTAGNKQKQQQQAIVANNSKQVEQSKATTTTTTTATTTEKSNKDTKDVESDLDSDDSNNNNKNNNNINNNNNNDDLSSDDEKKVSSVEDDDLEWEKFQQKLNRREKLEGKSKMSHTVHCPYFPENKQEYWWTYICDRKSRTLLTAPYHVTNLVDSEEIQLKFTAPRWPGVYSFTVCLRSDSYIGMDQQQELKLDVKEAAAIPTVHPQWEISESESEKNDQQGIDSEFTTDTSGDEE